MPVYACYGGTEYGAHSIVFDADDSQGPDAPVKTSMDWQWMAFPDYVRCRWVPQGDGNYECQFLVCLYFLFVFHSILIVGIRLSRRIVLR